MPQLLQPLTGGKLQLHNRLVMPPMATAKADEDGHVTDALLDYYDEKTKGGHLALVIVEHSYVDIQGRASKQQLSVASDSDVDGLKILATLFHANGVKAAMQLNHAGSAANNGGLEIVGPSAVPHPGKRVVPAELTEQQIHHITQAFRLAALRTREAGFDAVEIHSAHGYLLNQFYSPLTNRRTDDYGGNLDNRIRIHLEIIRAVREAVGNDFPILLRLGGSDYRQGGSTIEDSAAACRQFAKAGVDIIDISGGFCGYANPESSKAGYFSDISLAVKQTVSIPVILTGGITSAQQAEELLTRGAADLIGVGRALLNDSTWAAKAVRSLETR